MENNVLIMNSDLKSIESGGHDIQFLSMSDSEFRLFMQGIPKRWIHIIIQNINLVYTSFWATLCI
jgi:hypothetical protein